MRTQSDAHRLQEKKQLRWRARLHSVRRSGVAPEGRRPRAAAAERVGQRASSPPPRPPSFRAVRVPRDARAPRSFVLRRAKGTHGPSPGRVAANLTCCRCVQLARTRLWGRADQVTGRRPGGLLHLANADVCKAHALRKVKATAPLTAKRDVHEGALNKPVVLAPTVARLLLLRGLSPVCLVPLQCSRAGVLRDGVPLRRSICCLLASCALSTAQIG